MKKYTLDVLNIDAKQKKLAHVNIVERARTSLRLLFLLFSHFKPDLSKSNILMDKS